MNEDWIEINHYWERWKDGRILYVMIWVKPYECVYLSFLPGIYKTDGDPRKCYVGIGYESTILDEDLSLERQESSFGRVLMIPKHLRKYIPELIKASKQILAIYGIDPSSLTPAVGEDEGLRKIVKELKNRCLSMVNQ
ncbi:MAG: hypothetical protein ABIM42_05915 [candidate division WOR-3 bacterium]